MSSSAVRIAKKGRLSLSVRQDLLDRLAPHKHEINLSAHAEKLLEDLLQRLENQRWAERNADALDAHGRDIADTGLAGAEFERV